MVSLGYENIEVRIRPGNLLEELEGKAAKNDCSRFNRLGMEFGGIVNEASELLIAIPLRSDEWCVETTKGYIASRKDRMSLMSKCEQIASKTD